MKRLLTISTFIFALLPLSAQIADSTVVADFEARRNVHGAVATSFAIFDAELTPEQRQGLMVLFAYHPLPDLTDHPGSYFLENVDAALRARLEMEWGARVPDKEFRHFVLPIRVNNESLDGHRSVFYDELAPRVKGLSMADAILEVNHWCHEKATYAPSDGRTHSPLQTVSQALGRCGEESTFLVGALRSVGIPARQVYTPRWAHTDDNHAWVEAWADGRWYFLGACEPEPVLNLGWFNAPASRGMLMNTRVFGQYRGAEEVLLNQDGYTDINVTDRYAPVDTLHVQVVDRAGSPVTDAVVEFCIYNYAEFYPIAVKRTDRQGRASLAAGRGDIMVRAYDPASHHYGISHARADERNLISTIVLEAQPELTMDVDFTPPSQSELAYVSVSDELCAENDRRKLLEDSIRGAYEATFATDSPLLITARGNHATIRKFLEVNNSSDKAVSLLQSLSFKDLTDVSIDVLREQMQLDSSVMSPRVSNEFLTPFIDRFLESIPQDSIALYRSNPRRWVARVGSDIDARQQWYPPSVRMSPEAVWRGKVTDMVSRDIFLVRSARAMGIPARYDEVNARPQLLIDGRWEDIVFNRADDKDGSEKGVIVLDYTPVGHNVNPGYYYHFTLSKIDDGRFRLLNFPDDATFDSHFRNGQELLPGRYVLTTGQRLANGSILAAMREFVIQPGDTTRVELNLRHSDDAVQVIGSFNSENLYHDSASDSRRSILSTTGRGYYVLALIGRKGHEPTDHALRDIVLKSEELSKRPEKILILGADADALSGHDLTGLPANAVTGYDPEGKLQQELRENLNLDPRGDLPIIIIADTFNRIVYATDGYIIGSGEALLNTLHRLDQ